MLLVMTILAFVSYIFFNLSKHLESKSRDKLGVYCGDEFKLLGKKVYYIRDNREIDFFLVGWITFEKSCTYLQSEGGFKMNLNNIFINKNDANMKLLEIESNKLMNYAK